MSGQNSRAEPSPEGDLGSAKSKSTAALCWPKCIRAKPLGSSFEWSHSVFVLGSSHGVRIWRPSCVEYTDSVFLLTVDQPTFLDISPPVCRNEPRPWCSAYQSAEHHFAIFQLRHLSLLMSVSPFFLHLFLYVYPFPVTLSLPERNWWTGRTSCWWKARGIIPWCHILSAK